MILFDYYVNFAKNLSAHYLEKQRTFHIAFILKQKKLVALGINNYFKTHPRIFQTRLQTSEYKRLHAEISAVIKYGRDDCSDCNFLVLRIDNNMKLNNSKPCVICMKILEQVGFRNLYYSNALGEIVKL